MEKICENANQKLSAHARISKLTTPTQKKKIINSFNNVRFTYCPLIWMFSSKGCYKRIIKMYERSLRLIPNDYESPFDSLFSTLNEKAIHQRCINVLLTKVYKYLNGYSSNLMNEVFCLRQNHYNLMSLPLIIHVTNTYEILLFTERTNSGKHYPPKLRTVRHCSYLKIKSKFGTVIDIIVRFAPDILPMLVKSSLFFL